jgi:hypothetical protein
LKEQSFSINNEEETWKKKKKKNKKKKKAEKIDVEMKKEEILTQT